VNEAKKKNKYKKSIIIAGQTTSNNAFFSDKCFNTRSKHLYADSNAGVAPCKYHLTISKYTLSLNIEG